MVKITYKPARAPGKIAVFVAGKRTGMIEPVQGGFAYRTAGKPRFRAWGETFATVDAVKKSLRTDD